MAIAAQQARVVSEGHPWRDYCEIAGAGPLESELRSDLSCSIPAVWLLAYCYLDIMENYESETFILGDNIDS